MAETAAFSSPQLREWKTRLESDARNPLNTEALFSEWPSGIRLAPVYDGASLSSEHAYLKAFHEEWKKQRPDWKPLLKVSSVGCNSLSVSAVQDAEKLGFSAWSGSHIPNGHQLPVEDSLSMDPVTSSLCSGSFSDALSAIKAGQIPGKLSIQSTCFHHAGANEAEDIAYCLCLADYYYQMAEKQGKNSPEITLHLAAGPQFFLEIARLRALRLLWMNFSDRSGKGKNCGNIQSETSLIYWSKTDPDSNLIRHTSAALSAISGAADHLLIHPHTMNPAEAENAVRLAADIGHLALEEARMKNTFDPGSGSFLIEMFTHELAKKAWILFCEWREIPMDELLGSGFFVSLAEKGAARLKEQFAQGEKTLIGVNRHPSPLSRPCAPYPIPAAVGRDFKALSPVFLDA